MVAKNIKKTAFILVYIFLTYACFSQTGTARLTISNEGSPLLFNFNSFDKYDNGISLSAIGSAYYIDTICNPLPCVSTGTQWELTVRANSAVIIGDNGNNLPLNTIELEISGNDPGATYFTPVLLTQIDQPLIINGSQHAPGTYTTLTITYNIGTNTPLLGEEPDNYYVDIIFTLQKQ